jgi:alpha-tubulin suppressor-like RCC1 family protein
VNATTFESDSRMIFVFFQSTSSMNIFHLFSLNELCLRNVRRCFLSLVVAIAALLSFGYSSEVFAVKYTKISAGFHHTCAVVSTGQVHCWGENNLGQLGNGTTVDSATPVVVRNISTATAVAVGGDSTCAILASGGLRCWGSNVEGQLGTGSSDNSALIPAAVNLNGDFATSVSMASSFACASTSSSVYCWGFGGNGRLGNGQNTSSSTPVTVRSSLGLISASSVSVGTSHACALRSDGGVRCWGAGSLGQLGDGLATDSNVAVAPSGLPVATHVEAGNNFTCALMSSGGGGRCWGVGANGRLGNNTTTNSNTPVIVLRQDNLSIVTLHAALQLSTGSNHTCALRSGPPNMVCWGNNSDSQLGLGAGGPSQYNVAIPVTEIGVPVQISAGTSHTCAVFENGSAQCWGSNFGGRLGLGYVSNNELPTPQWVVAPNCTFDIDDDGTVSALSDGLMIVRAMLGMSGDAVISGTVGANATRPTWPQVRAHLATSCGMPGVAP